MTVFPEFPDQKFGIIYADPPWDYRGQLQHAGVGSGDTGGAVRHYPTVKLSDLMKLDVSGIAEDDCLLFMWATNPHLDQAIELGKAWGFGWATVAFVWDKERVNPGFYTLSQCELCLVFKKGRIPAPRGARNVRQMVRPLGETRRGPGENRRDVPLTDQDRDVCAQEGGGMEQLGAGDPRAVEDLFVRHPVSCPLFEI